METVTPAQLSFLALYNPSLGWTDETLQDQVVYYYSSKSSQSQGTRRRSHDKFTELEHEELNEQLRQVGLAQGMVEFAKAFSNGESIDSIESEKSRSLLHEIEPGWWLVASVDLTRLESKSDAGASKVPATTSKPTIEYLGREVCPQSLLLQKLLRAHSIFLLHHAPSLTELFEQLSRRKFCEALERFWNKFISDWEVLLQGNPAVDIFNGLKLAAGGELGIGVGEEEWGSGEREVLEGFTARTAGLIDIVVSRFGEPPKGLQFAGNETLPLDASNKDTKWLGCGNPLHPSDGVLYSGTGAVTRSSLKNVSAWMEWIYKYGMSTYGVRDNPLSAPRRKRRKVSPFIPPEPQVAPESIEQTQLLEQSHKPVDPTVQIETNSSALKPEPPVGIPPPIVVAKDVAQEPKVTSPNDSVKQRSEHGATKWVSPPDDPDKIKAAETLMKYMTLGIYGSSWGIPSARPTSDAAILDDRHQDGEKNGDTKRPGESSKRPKSLILSDKPPAEAEQDATRGLFVVGLQGDLEDEDIPVKDGDVTAVGADGEVDLEKRNWNRRIMVRTMHVERTRTEADENPQFPQHGLPKLQNFERVRVVVYVRQPFIFTFLFNLHTDSLALTTLYRSLHHQLGPLQRPLLVSTSPKNVSERLWEAVSPKTVSPVDSTQPIYDLVYDPANLSVHTTIPSIPEAGSAAAEGLGSGAVAWTRLEALNVHSQILNTYISTRRRTSELERTCKTGRGWWVVWMRLPREAASAQSFDPGSGVDGYREAILIRKASDYVLPTVRKSAGSMFARDAGAGNGWGAGRLAEGIGIDTRKYIDGLLSLNR